MAKPLIKWPGGKAGEIEKFRHLIPEYDRYVEPFFGGGALYFCLAPKSAAINDISSSLMNFYRLVKQQDMGLHDLLVSYSTSFTDILTLCEVYYNDIYGIYYALRSGVRSAAAEKGLEDFTADLVRHLRSLTAIVRDYDAFRLHLAKAAKDKMNRIIKNPGSKNYTCKDLKDNLITGFASGFYMYFRAVFNDISQSGSKYDDAYKAANFYFIREYCYGSMFRYSKKSGFNIPYGGISYNKKNFLAKIDYLFSSEVSELLSGAQLYNMDFEDFLNKINLTDRDFLFLDPPYDTDFSDYEGHKFDRADQKRLADYLRSVKARFILVIKNTDYIYDLYRRDFRILSFDNRYTYNVRSRNNRVVKHLIITNISDRTD
jgi:DNA adenine methylase